MLLQPLQLPSQHLGIFAHVESPPSQLPPVVHCRNPSLCGLVLCAVLIIFIAFDLQDQRQIRQKPDQEIRGVGVTDAKVFIRYNEFQMVVSRIHDLGLLKTECRGLLPGFQWDPGGFETVFPVSTIQERGSGMLEVSTDVEINGELYNVSFWATEIGIGNDGIGGYEFWGYRGIDRGRDYVEEFTINEPSCSATRVRPPGRT